MNVLQLTCHFSPNVGGVETHLDDLVSALVKRKHNVFVLTYRPLTTNAKWKIYENKKLLQILRIPWFPGHFYELVNQPIVEFLYLLPGLFFITPFIIFSKNPKVIHAHGLIAGFIGVIWGKVFRKKVIISTHSIYHFPTAGVYRNFSSWLFSNASEVLCLSEQSKEEIAALGVSKKKIHVFTYWVDQERFQKIIFAKHNLGLQKEFVVLFVGRLIAEKGINELLHAAESWDKHITLVVAGTGPLEEEVIKHADGKHIIFAGKILQEKLPTYYSAADVLIVPSIHEEGFGRVIIESLACGTPIIAANRGGIVEAINEKVGYLITITPESIKKVIEYCYNNRIELEKKSKEAQILAKKKYSEKNVEVILASYI